MFGAALISRMVFTWRPSKELTADEIAFVAGQALLLGCARNVMAIPAMAVEAIRHMAAAAIVGIKTWVNWAECLINETFLCPACRHGLVKNLIISLMAAGTTTCPYSK